MNSQLIYLTKDEKQFLEMYLKFMNASNKYIYFSISSSSCFPLLLFAFLMGNTVALSYAKWQVGYISLKTK